MDTKQVEKNIATINDGRVASLASDHVWDYIEQMKKTKIQLLMQNYRSGKTDIETYISGVAAICALDDLQSDMKRRIVKGRIEEEKERENHL